jgi:hypothetical protein
MTTPNIGMHSPAVQKIVQEIAATGESRAVVTKRLWKELAIDPRLIHSMARQFMAGQCKYGKSGCVWIALKMELCQYENREKCKVLGSQAEVEKALSLLIPRFGKPTYRSENELKGRRIAWPTKTDERALQMCTLIHSLGIQPYHSRHQVSIYGPLTDRMKVNQVIKKLDG